MESDISKLPYLQAIIKESFRLHPPGAFITRESTENCSIAGIDVPEKTQVFINLWFLGRDPEHWEKSLEFCPERFLSKEGCGQNPTDMRGQQHFHCLPFGNGLRGCPGSSLALNMMLTILAALIQCFEWKIGDAVASRLDMKEGTSLSAGRAGKALCMGFVLKHSQLAFSQPTSGGKALAASDTVTTALIHTWSMKLTTRNK